jgi:hypothetical protein
MLQLNLNDLENFELAQLPPELRDQLRLAAEQLQKQLLKKIEQRMTEIAENEGVDMYAMVVTIRRKKKKLIATYTLPLTDKGATLVCYGSENVLPLFEKVCKTMVKDHENVQTKLMMETVITTLGGGYKETILNHFDKTSKLEIQFDKNDDLRAYYADDSGQLQPLDPSLILNSNA